MVAGAAVAACAIAGGPLTTVAGVAPGAVVVAWVSVVAAVVGLLALAASPARLRSSSPWSPQAKASSASVSEELWSGGMFVTRSQGLEVGDQLIELAVTQVCDFAVALVAAAAGEAVA